MRKISTLLVAMMLFAAATATATARTDKDERQIDFKELPAEAQNFIKKHFAAESVSLVVVDKGIISNEYDVTFASGLKLEFEGDGQWSDIDYRQGEVPHDLIPKKIADYIAKHYPATKVIELSREKHEWEVKLSNGRELTFDKAFKLTDIDD